MDLVWQDPPHVGPGPKAKSINQYAKIGLALKMRRGAWALVDTVPNHGMAQRWRNGFRRAYDHQVEVTVQMHDDGSYGVYARWVT